MGLGMRTEECIQISANEKRVYIAPGLVLFGDAKDMTRNVNEPGPGDAIFSVLRHS